MYKIQITSQFKRSFDKLTKHNPELEKRLEKALDLMQSDPHHSGLKSHLVDYAFETGNIWSSRVTGDVRILWCKDENDSFILILLKVGGHDDVY